MFSLCVCVEALCACSGTRGSEFIASALSLIHSKASLILVYTLFSCFTIHALQITMALTANINFTQHNHAEPSSLLISPHLIPPPLHFTRTHHPHPPHPHPSTPPHLPLHPPITLAPLTLIPPPSTPPFYTHPSPSHPSIPHLHPSTPPVHALPEFDASGMELGWPNSSPLWYGD